MKKVVKLHEFFSVKYKILTILEYNLNPSRR